MARTARGRPSGRRRNAVNRGANRRGRTNPARLFTQRAANVRNRTTTRPKPPGYQNLSLSAFRRLAAYPTSGTKPSPSQPAPASAWWLDGLKWFGSIALQLAGVFLITSDPNLKKRNVRASFAITGCGTSIAIGPGDLLAFTAVSSATSDLNKRNCPYEQARIKWVRAHVYPSADLSKRGGFYAAAMVPVDRDDEKVVIGEISHDFEQLAVQPGAVVRPITQPLSVSWSPTVLEQGMSWSDLGPDSQSGNMGPACVLAIAYSDLAVDDRAGSATGTREEYVPSRSLIEIHLEGQVDVRRPGLSTLVPSLTYTDNTKVQVKDCGSTYSIPHSRIVWNANKIIGHLDTDPAEFLLTRDQVRSSLGSLSLGQMAID